MAYHYWGDEDFDWNGLGAAINHIHDFCLRWGRLGTHVKEKYGCYDDKTEVLTKAGWKLFKDIDVHGDLFATLSDDEYLEYAKATHFTKEWCDDLLYRVVTRGVDLAVTQNHKLWIAKAPTAGGIGNKGGKNYPFELQSYHKLFRKHKQFMKGAKWIGKEPETFLIPARKNKPTLTVPIVPFLRFLGWFLSEGVTSGGQQVTICLNGTDGGYEAETVGSILSQLPWKFNGRRRGSGFLYVICNAQLAAFLNEECGRLAHGKRVPDFVKGLAPRLIKEMLLSAWEGDGCKAETAYVLSTVSRKLADDYTECVLKAGDTASILARDPRQGVMGDGRKIQGKHPEYVVNWMTSSNLHVSSNSHDTNESLAKKEFLEQYSGYVYCVTVPGHKLYVRRNFKSVWCGNSARVSAWFWHGDLHGLLYPGHVACRYKGWHRKPLWWCDVYVFPRIARWTGVLWLAQRWQMKVYGWAYEGAVRRWPHLRDEILQDADHPDLIRGGREVHDRYWTRVGGDE